MYSGIFCLVQGNAEDEGSLSVWRRGHARLAWAGVCGAVGKTANENGVPLAPRIPPLKQRHEMRLGKGIVRTGHRIFFPALCALCCVHNECTEGRCDRSFVSAFIILSSAQERQKNPGCNTEASFYHSTGNLTVLCTRGEMSTTNCLQSI